MKNSIVIFSIVLTSLGLTAFNIINLDDSVAEQVKMSNNYCVDTQLTGSADDKVFSDFFYDFGPRFEPIKKTDLDNARSIIDFLPIEETQSIVTYKSVSVIIIINDRQSDIRETGYSDLLTDKQLKLLQSSDYSTNFLIRAEYLEVNRETNKLEENYTTPHLTIVPEKQAEYEGGKDALLKYLSDQNKENTANLNEDKLQPAKLYFTVTTNGTISNVRLDRTSGYPKIDKTMIELVTNAPRKWMPAKNTRGEKVDQELVVSFGMVGC